MPWSRFLAAAPTAAFAGTLLWNWRRYGRGVLDRSDATLFFVGVLLASSVHAAIHPGELWLTGCWGAFALFYAIVSKGVRARPTLEQWERAKANRQEQKRLARLASVHLHAATADPPTEDSGEVKQHVREGSDAVESMLLTFRVDPTKLHAGRGAA